MKRSIYLLLGVIFLLSSCYEEPLTKGIIAVYDRHGNAMPDVVVTLSQEDLGVGVNQTNVVSIQTSDSQGQTEHVVEAEAIMNIDAVLYLGVDTLLYGHSAIRLEHGKTVKKNVEIIEY